MKKRFKRLSHSIYECKYHIVFCPKYRLRILDDEIAQYVQSQIYQLAKQKEGVEVLELNIQRDHVHLLLDIPPKHKVSGVVGFLKGKLAIQLFKRYQSLGRRYCGRHFWSRGYCVSTVGIDEEKIRLYVKWQEHNEKRLEATQQTLFN